MTRNDTLALEFPKNIKDLRDFSIIDFKEIYDKTEIDNLAVKLRTVISKVKDYSAKQGYTTPNFALSNFIEHWEKQSKDIDILLEVAPQPWQLRSTLHFRVSTNQYGSYVKYELGVEIRSGVDVIHRAKIKDSIGSK